MFEPYFLTPVGMTYLTEEQWQDLEFQIPEKLEKSIILLFDNWNTGEIHLQEVISVAILLSCESVANRVSKIFEFFDYERKGWLNEQGITVLVTIVLTGFCRMIESQNFPERIISNVVMQIMDRGRLISKQDLVAFVQNSEMFPMLKRTEQKK